LRDDEVAKLLEAARGNRYGHRDYTMLLMTWRPGLRASELCDLTFAFCLRGLPRKSAAAWLDHADALKDPAQSRSVCYPA